MSKRNAFRRVSWLSGGLAACLALGMGTWGLLAVGQDSPRGDAQQADADTLVLWADDLAAALVPGAKVRTSEGPTASIVDDLVHHLPRMRVVPGPMANTATPFEQAGGANALLTFVADEQALLSSNVYIPTGYSSGTMAIMRSDTDITSWQALRGRTVCVLDQMRYAGQMAARYGAVEQRFKAPADSLLALRTGACDAAVHDSAMLEELIKLPEWKKFSATLPVENRGMLTFVVSGGNKSSTVLLQKSVQRWKADNYLDQVKKKTVRDIAFEVYLDQTVTDCH